MGVKIDNEHLTLCEAEFAWPIETAGNGASAIEDLSAPLVFELARVGWEVPGIDVTVRTVGRGKMVFRYVSEISGTTEKGPFRLGFGIPQREISRHLALVTGLASAVVPPGIEIHYFSDGSGPAVEKYLTKDWAGDGSQLMNRFSANSRLNGEPRTKLRYQRENRGSNRLVAVGLRDDREYGPQGLEPRALSKRRIDRLVRGFINGLIDRLAKMPTADGLTDVTPQGDTILRRLAYVDLVPVPASFPKLYCWIAGRDASRLSHYSDPSDVVEEDYVLAGNGWRLLPLSSLAIHPRGTDGFNYAATSPEAHGSHVIYSHQDEPLVVEVELKALNEIYVVDSAAFEKAREVAWAQLKDDERLPDRQLNSLMGETEKTMVPAAEYVEGTYEKPVYLIGRQLGHDEARLMRGPVRLLEDDKHVEVTFTDEATGRVVELFSSTRMTRFDLEHARRVAKFASDRMNGHEDYEVDLSKALAREPEPEVDITGLLTP